MELTDKDKKMVADLRKLQKQQRVNRQFGLIMLPIMISAVAFFCYTYASALGKWDSDISPWVSKSQLGGIIFIMAGVLCVIGTLRLIIGDRRQTAVNELLLRLIGDHEKGNSQQEGEPQ
jgi:hypothetical protein